MKVSRYIRRYKIICIKKIMLCAFVLGSFGCASVERSTLLGAGTGATLGAVSVSSMARQDHKKMTLKGAGIGLLVGGLTGYILHQVMDKKERKVRRETLFNLESHGISTSFENVNFEKHNTFVTSPSVREDYVETHTVDDGRTLIQGHKVWKIEGSPQFNLGRPKKRKAKR